MRDRILRFRLIVVAAGSLWTLAVSARWTDDDPEGPRTPHRVEAPGVENLYRLGPGLYSGAQPEGEAGISALKRLGIRTIISVDGAQPDVELARRQGIRYVHLPIGYDAVPADQAVRLVKAVRSLPGPVYIHCHHGKHRGPAAAAVCAIATQGWTGEQARNWLETAGTAPDYQGLFASVARSRPPSDAELDRIADADLPERANVPALVESMVEIDAHWDRIKTIQKAGFTSPRDAPDLDPPHEALMLTERFRESLRHEATRSRGPEFARQLTEAGEAAARLQGALKILGPKPAPDALTAAGEACNLLGKSCVNCHARFRDH